MLNPYIIVPLAAWAVAQIVKFGLSAARGQADAKYLYVSGGMPSAHAAVVTALAATALILDGPNSQLFGITVVLAAIVMYDSFGVRRSAGEQAAVLNHLLDDLSRGRDGGRLPKVRLRELLGHKPLEVSVGAVLGFLVAALFQTGRLGTQLHWLSTRPGHGELLIYALVFGLVLIGGLAIWVTAKRRYRKIKPAKRWVRAVLLKTLIVAGAGGLLVLAEYETNTYLSWRVWPLLVLSSLAVFDAVLISRWRTQLPALEAGELEVARKAKWLAKPKRR